MTHKIFNIEKRPSITPDMEKAVMEAYKSYDSDAACIKVPQRAHLGTSHQKGVCCDHWWKPVTPSEENLKHLKELFDEQELTSPQYCGRCGAVAMFDNLPNRLEETVLTLWAYDATARFFGKPRKEHTHAAPREKGKRA